eukprot:TRINITY_DN23206_c0_g1_i1.p1 TRINITY_DN23206_c0_g1~~TRINITY_DN23206_c0_g1_i1.p1  ORF type:complete len:1698 (-),score=442.51 TRINITY_DN23206_c0_g1_i1:55-5148(-)
MQRQSTRGSYSAIHAKRASLAANGVSASGSRRSSAASASKPNKATSGSLSPSPASGKVPGKDKGAAAALAAGEKADAAGAEKAGDLGVENDEDEGEEEYEVDEDAGEECEEEADDGVYDEEAEAGAEDGDEPGAADDGVYDEDADEGAGDDTEAADAGEGGDDNEEEDGDGGNEEEEADEGMYEEEDEGVEEEEEADDAVEEEDAGDAKVEVKGHESEKQKEHKDVKKEEDKKKQEEDEKVQKGEDQKKQKEHEEVKTNEDENKQKEPDSPRFPALQLPAQETSPLAYTPLAYSPQATPSLSPVTTAEDFELMQFLGGLLEGIRSNAARPPPATLPQSSYEKAGMGRMTPTSQGIVWKELEGVGKASPCMGGGFGYMTPLSVPKDAEIKMKALRVAREKSLAEKNGKAHPFDALANSAELSAAVGQATRAVDDVIVEATCAHAQSPTIKRPSQEHLEHARQLATVAAVGAAATARAHGTPGDAARAAGMAAFNEMSDADCSPFEIAKAAVAAASDAGGSTDDVRQIAINAATESAVARGGAPLEIGKLAAAATKAAGGLQSDVARAAGMAVIDAIIAAGATPSDVGRTAAVAAASAGASPSEVAAIAGEGAAKAAMLQSCSCDEVVQAAVEAVEAAGGERSDIINMIGSVAADYAIAHKEDPKEAARSYVKSAGGSPLYQRRAMSTAAAKAAKASGGSTSDAAKAAGHAAADASRDAGCSLADVVKSAAHAAAMAGGSPSDVLEVAREAAEKMSTFAPMKRNAASRAPAELKETLSDKQAVICASEAVADALISQGETPAVVGEAAARAAKAAGGSPEDVAACAAEAAAKAAQAAHAAKARWKKPGNAVRAIHRIKLLQGQTSNEEPVGDFSAREGSSEEGNDNGEQDEAASEDDTVAAIAKSRWTLATNAVKTLTAVKRKKPRAGGTNAKLKDRQNLSESATWGSPSQTAQGDQMVPPGPASQTVDAPKIDPESADGSRNGNADPIESGPESPGQGSTSHAAQRWGISSKAFAAAAALKRSKQKDSMLEKGTLAESDVNDVKARMGAADLQPNSPNDRQHSRPVSERHPKTEAAFAAGSIIEVAVAAAHASQAVGSSPEVINSTTQNVVSKFLLSDIGLSKQDARAGAAALGLVAVEGWEVNTSLIDRMAKYAVIDGPTMDDDQAAAYMAARVEMAEGNCPASIARSAADAAIATGAPLLKAAQFATDAAASAEVASGVHLSKAVAAASMVGMAICEDDTAARSELLKYKPQLIKSFEVRKRADILSDMSATAAAMEGASHARALVVFRRVVAESAIKGGHTGFGVAKAVADGAKVASASVEECAWAASRSLTEVALAAKGDPNDIALLAAASASAAGAERELAALLAGEAAAHAAAKAAWKPPAVVKVAAEAASAAGGEHATCIEAAAIAAALLVAAAGGSTAPVLRSAEAAARAAGATPENATRAAEKAAKSLAVEAAADARELAAREAADAAEAAERKAIEDAEAAERERVENIRREEDRVMMDKLKWLREDSWAAARGLSPGSVAGSDARSSSFASAWASGADFLSSQESKQVWSEGSLSPLGASSSLRRQALRSFLVETCGSVANAFDKMVDLSMSRSTSRRHSRPPPPPATATADRLQYVFSARGFRRALSRLGFGVDAKSIWWQEVFLSIDVDGDGLVSLQDLIDALVLGQRFAEEDTYYPEVFFASPA